MILGTAAIEQSKYERMWAKPEYSGHSPGEHWAAVFGEVAGLKPGDEKTAIDLGCGAGIGGYTLMEIYGINVTFLDHVDVLEVPFRERQTFIQQCLWEPIPRRNPRYDYGYCCDVMEHIPSEYVMLTLERIREVCGHAFFSIAHLPDSCGEMIGETLHLTVQPFEWWRDRLADIGEVLHGRDMMGESLFYVRCS